MTDRWNLYEDGSYKGFVPVPSRSADDPRSAYRARARARLEQMKADPSSALFAAYARAGEPLAETSDKTTEANDMSQGQEALPCATSADKLLGVSGAPEVDLASSKPVECLLKGLSLAPLCSGAPNVWSPFAMGGRAARMSQRPAHLYSKLASVCWPMNRQEPLKSDIAYLIARVDAFHGATRTRVSDVTLYFQAVRGCPSPAREHRATRYHQGSFAFTLLAQRNYIDLDTYGLGFASPDSRGQEGCSPHWLVQDGSHRILTRTSQRNRQIAAAVAALEAAVRTRQAVLRNFDAASKQSARSLPTPKYMAEAGNDLFETALAVAVTTSRLFKEVCDVLSRAAGIQADVAAERAKTLVNIGYASWTDAPGLDDERRIDLSPRGRRAVENTLKELSGSARTLAPHLAGNLTALSQSAAAH